MGKGYLHSFSADLDRILFILAGNDYIHQSLDEFEYSWIQPLVSMVTDRVMIGKNGVSTFSRLFFIHSFSYLQVMMTCMGAWRSLKFSQIRPPTAE